MAGTGSEQDQLTTSASVPTRDYRHVIIAGANKCGTTSLFRYLSAHPAVTGSEVKETGFFQHPRDYASPATYAQYLDLFGRAAARTGTLLEATPNYLDAGHRTAPAIHALLSRPRIIFMLRDPSERLASYFRSRQGFRMSPTFGMDFAEFVETATRAATNEPETLSERDRALRHEVLKGCYARHLGHFLTRFEAGDLLILFYDDLRTDTGAVTRRAARFAGLDDTFYGNFDFSVENRSRNHRSSFLRTWASLANRKLEPFLNRVPFTRRYARAIYAAVNTSPASSVPLDPDAMSRLRDFHVQANRDLGEVLRANSPRLRLPDWLDQPASSGAAAGG